MKSLPFLLFFTVFSMVVTGMHAYVWLRVIHDPALGPTWTEPLQLVWFVLAAACPIAIVLGRTLPRRLGNPISRLAYGWFGLLTLLLCFLLLAEPLRYLLITKPSDVVSIARLLAYASLAGVLVLLVHGTYRALATPQVKHIRLKLDSFPAELSGFRLVQISDVHIGPSLGREWLSRVVARINELEPDLIAITGDLVDGSVSRLAPEVEPLRHLKSRHGTYFVTGNHEYYSGAASWLDALRRLNIKPLRNESVAIGERGNNFRLVGVDDWNAFGEGHGRDLPRALAERTSGQTTILLAHQPKQIHEAADLGVTLQLSGHTHGGQIFPFHFFVRLQQPFVAGLHRVKNTQLYISRGTGFWGPPLRVGAPPEITLLELSPADGKSTQTD